MTKSERMVVLALTLTLALCLPVSSHAGELALVDLGSAAARWDVQGDYDKVVLTVALPNGSVVRRELKGGDPVVFELDAAAKDGSYTYELRGVPRIDASVRRELAAARKAGNEAAVIEQLEESGRLPRESVQSGSFLVKDGAIVARDQEERPRGTSAKSGIGLITAEDQVIPDDLIVQGSGCFGFDCVNNESFGFDTIRLKENNTRIKFEDTSTGTFPSTDWQLTANDSASGGQNRFSIEDVTAARVPFTIEGGTTTNSLYLDSTGRIGFRTSTPVLDLHINTSNTPGIRLEQNNSGGFTAQTWDIAGNEANFFVRDVTGGSLLPFRIRPGAPTSSIDISGDGDVGVGTGSPDAKLHVASTGAGGTDGKLLVENTSGTAAARELLELNNNGQATMVFKNTAETERWANGTFSTSFVINNQANGGVELTVSNTGNVTASGSMNATAFNVTSDRNLKKDIVPVRREEILAKLAALPIATWSFKSEDVRHVGPMAQDFSAAFGLGGDDTHIAVNDLAGVTVAAVQALHEEVSAKDAEIVELKNRLAKLEKLIEQLSDQQ